MKLPRLLAALALAVATTLASAAEPSQVELLGRVGSRDALLVVYSTPLPDGATRITGEYVILSSLQRHYVAGDRSASIGVTTLGESRSPILFGRPGTGSLRGTWHDGRFRGTRYGPGGQEREQFQFSETFPSMTSYGTSLQCEATEGGYRANLAYVVEAGRLRPGSLSWTSRIDASGQVCVLGGGRVTQRDEAGGLRFVVDGIAGGCEVLLRDLGEWVRVSARGCAAACGSQAYLEPMLVDRRGGCRLLRPVAH